jgi:hypothetical protein
METLSQRERERAGQVVQACLPSRYEALSSNSNAAKKKKMKERERVGKVTGK